MWRERRQMQATLVRLVRAALRKRPGEFVELDLVGVQRAEEPGYVGGVVFVFFS
jgi:hypothetical protein